MDELKNIYATRLHDLLENRIVGRVLVTIVFDTIIVRINSFDNFYYRKEIHNFLSLVNKNTSVSDISKMILEDYKARLTKAVMKRYFITKKEGPNDILYLSEK